MYNPKDIILFYQPTSRKHQLSVYSIIFSAVMIVSVSSSSSPKILDSVISGASLCLFIFIEIYLLDKILSKWLRKRIDSAGNRTLESLRVSIQQNKPCQKVRVSKKRKFEIFDNRLRIAIGLDGKSYEVFYDGPIKEEFEAYLYTFDTKFFSFSQKYVIIPIEASEINKLVG